MEGESIVIGFKEGYEYHYKPDEYTEYYYDRKCFIVIRNNQWIGIYNLDCIEYVRIEKRR